MSKADNKQLEEAIKRLEHIDRYYDCNNYYSKYDLDCIETVLKELERLQEENRQQRWQLNSVFEKGFIHKDKIREKIEEQEELKEKYLKMREYGQVDIRLYKIAILKELLEGK